MTNISNPTVLVASDSSTDAALVKKLLDDEFKNVFTSTNPDKSAEDFVRHPPDVLVLAFYTLEKSQHYYLRLFRLCTALHLKPYRTIILCSKDELRQAYALCRDGLFDDYILFWPMVHDALRLPMSVHLALRELAVLRDGRTPADFAAQAGRLEEMETLLDQQMAQGVQPIEKTGHAVGQTESRIAGIPVIMMTGKGEKDIVKESLTAGAVDFMVKPFARDTLLGKVAKVLRGT